MSALSLFLSLMACTLWSQLILTSLGWYVIPAGHFPQKSLSRNPRICFPLSSLPDHALLPLTHDLTTSCIGGIQVDDVWALYMLHFHVYPKSVCCSHVCRGLEACLHILPPILGFLWHEPFSGFSFFKAYSSRGWAFAWPWAFPYPAHSLAIFCSLCVSCHTALPFLLWRYLTHSLDLLVTLGILGPFTFLGPFWPFS